MKSVDVCHQSALKENFSVRVQCHNPADVWRQHGCFTGSFWGNVRAEPHALDPTWTPGWRWCRCGGRFLLERPCFLWNFFQVHLRHRWDTPRPPHATLEVLTPRPLCRLPETGESEGSASVKDYFELWSSSRTNPRHRAQWLFNWIIWAWQQIRAWIIEAERASLNTTAQPQHLHTSSASNTASTETTQ